MMMKCIIIIFFLFNTIDYRFLKCYINAFLSICVYSVTGQTVRKFETSFSRSVLQYNNIVLIELDL